MSINCKDGECVEDLRTHVTRCQDAVMNRISHLETRQDHLETRQDNVEALHSSTKDALKAAEIQRKQNQEHTDSRLTTLEKTIKTMIVNQDTQYRRLYAHMESEEKVNKAQSQNIEKVSKSVDKVIATLKAIKQETEDNADWIEKVKKNWARLTFIGTGAVGTVGTIWWLINWMQSNGMIILFPAT